MRVEQTEKSYHSDYGIVYSCQYHVIFCPKYRRKVLGYRAIEVEVMPDHVHLLLDVDPRIGVNKVVRQIKGYTSHQLRKEFPHLKSRLPTLWTRGRFISSTGTVSLDAVKRYIESQKGV